MRIAITGASGFIGTELLSLLKETDNTVVALTRGSSDAEDEAQVLWRTTDYSKESLTEVLAGTDTVVHLAGVRGTTPDPADYVINEEMTESILAAMAVAGVKRIVFASTISVYDDETLIPWTEETPLKGRTAYGDSKIRCEKLIRKYADECGFTYGIVRIAQVLGLGEKRRAMMNVFIDTAAAGGQLRVIGRSVVKRQYLYVKDLVKILARNAFCVYQPGDRADRQQGIRKQHPDRLRRLQGRDHKTIVDGHKQAQKKPRHRAEGYGRSDGRDH